MFNASHSNFLHSIWRRIMSFGFVSICFLSLLFIIVFIFLLFTGVFIGGVDALLTRRIFLPIAEEYQLLNEHVDYLNYKKIIYNGMHILFSKSKYDENSIQEIADNLVSDYSVKELNSANFVNYNGYFGIWLLISKKMLISNTPNIISDALDYLKNNNLFKYSFNFKFFLENDSAYPEAAGILGSIIGTLLSMLICVIIAVPIGVAAGIYFSEISVDNKFNDFIFIVVTNLVSVPTVIYGLFASTVFASFLNVPRSSTLLAGITLALIALPHIILIVISIMQSVPNGIKYSAFALGASKIQVFLHHSLPIASQQLISGILLSIARVIGETAPLMIIGMLIFSTESSWNLTGVSTTLPIRIYLWSKNPNSDYQNLASGAILILIILLMFISISARFIKR